MTNLGLAALAMGLEALWALAAVAADTGQGRARQSHSRATTASVRPPPISSRLHRQERHGALKVLGLLPASAASAASAASPRLHRHGALNVLGLLPASAASAASAASVALRGAIPNAAAAHHRVGVRAMVRVGASILDRLKGPWFVAKWIWSSKTQSWMLKSQNHHQ